ncbi:MAG: CopG family ribbon-helix-helix protein [Promethearchaeota archaeon]
MEGNKEKYKRFTISLPHSLYDDFESFRKKMDLSRSDIIRKAMRSFMVSEENIPISSGNVVGCITTIISHEHFEFNSQNSLNHSHDFNNQHEHEYRSTPIYANIQQTESLLFKDIQHHFKDVIISTLHIHLEFEKCMEILAVSGQYERIKALRDRLKKLKSVLSISFFVISTLDEGDNIKSE